VPPPLGLCITSDLGALLSVLTPWPAPQPHRTPRIDPLTEQPAAIVVCAPRRAASAQGDLPVALLLPHPAAANPDHDSTLEFGVATRAGASVTCRKGVPLRIWLCARDRNASSNLLWGPLPRHQHRISTVILATAAVYIRVGNFPHRVSCRLSSFQDLLERVEVGCHRRLDPGGGEGSQQSQYT
jgi:hypothetical protein